jgi:hypothetical protein
MQRRKMCDKRRPADRRILHAAFGSMFAQLAGVPNGKVVINGVVSLVTSEQDVPQLGEWREKW